MGDTPTDGVRYLAWDTSDLSTVERDVLLEELLDDIDTGVGVVDSAEELEALTEANDMPSVGASAPGPRVGDIVDPELLLIVLESTLIVIEASKVRQKLQGTGSGSGLLALETFRSALESQDQQVSEGSAGSVDDIMQEE